MAQRISSKDNSDHTDPQLPPIKKYMYMSVTGASISIIVYIIYFLLNCGCPN